MGQLDNVLFDVVTTKYDASLLGVRIDETILCSSQPGHIVYMGSGKEGDVKSQSERERGSMWRLMTEPTWDVDALIEGGVYVRITYERVPETKGWCAPAVPRQYKVDFVVEAMANSRKKVLALSTQDVS